MIFSFLKKHKSPFPFFIKGRQDIVRVHITKTAGTSLSSALKFYGPNKSAGIKKHYFVREIINIIGEDKWTDSFKFSFVRNPFDRLFSLYRYKLRTGRILTEKQGNSFERWLKEVVVMMHEDEFDKSKPQSEWLKDQNGEINLDFLGRFETLVEDCKRLAIELDINFQVPHLNQTLPIVHYSSYYSEEMREIVEHHYKQDLELFNYRFEKL